MYIFKTYDVATNYPNFNDQIDIGLEMKKKAEELVIEEINLGHHLNVERSFNCTALSCPETLYESVKTVLYGRDEIWSQGLNLCIRESRLQRKGRVGGGEGRAMCKMLHIFPPFGSDLLFGKMAGRPFPRSLNVQGLQAV